jgi:site-specific DNA recombinase
MRWTPPKLDAVLRARAEHSQEGQLFDRLQADRTRLVQLGDDYGDGTIDKPTYVRQKARLTQRIDTVQRALDQIAAARTLVSLPPAGQIRSEWEKATIDQRRAIIAAVVEKVLLHPTGSGHRRVWRIKGGWGFDPATIEITWKV